MKISLCASKKIGHNRQTLQKMTPALKLQKQIRDLYE